MTLFTVLALVAVALIGLFTLFRLSSGARTPQPTSLHIDAQGEANPQDILYSLPTLADPLPPVDETAVLPVDAFYLHEDEWRQVEFVAAVNGPTVEQELAELRTFMRNHRNGAGWTAIHVRTTRPEGLLPLRIASPTLDTMLPQSAPARALSVGTPPWGPHVVVDGFAFELAPNVILYGHSVHGFLASLALAGPTGSIQSKDVEGVLDALSRELELRLVDWPAAEWVELQ